MSRILAPGLIVMVILCVQFMAWGVVQTQRVRPDARLKIGEHAPDFSLPGIDGKTYTLQSFSGSEILVLVFTANHCPTAQAYESRIQQLHDDYSDQSVAVVAVSPNDPNALRLDEFGWTDVGDSFEDMQVRARDRGFTFPYLYDGDTQAMSREYGPVSTPHVFIFDKTRRLRYAGRIDDNENPAKVRSRDTRNTLDALLAGNAVPVTTTKTFGCSIKWSEKRATVQQSLERWAAEPVTLEAIDTAAIRMILRNESEKLRLIIVWATSNSLSVTEFPNLVMLNRMYRKRAFEAITLSADKPGQENQVLEFLKGQKASMTNYMIETDNKHAVIKTIDSEWSGRLPFIMLVEPGGNSLYRHSGTLDVMVLRKIISDWVGRTWFAIPGAK